MVGFEAAEAAVPNGDNIKVFLNNFPNGPYVGVGPNATWALIGRTVMAKALGRMIIL